MQPPKPVRIPLTIVGIVSNVVALVLVCVMLYSESQWPTMEQMTDLIKKVAKTHRPYRLKLGSGGSSSEDGGE